MLLRSYRRRVVGAIPLLVVALLLAAMSLPAHAQDAEVDAEAAAAWLAGDYDAGNVTTGGGLADLLFALGGADAEPETAAAALADLLALAIDYIDSESDPDAGRIGKAILGINAGGGDPTDVGGTDLVAMLLDMMVTEGDDTGRFGDANLFTQALAVMGLETTEAGAPAESAQWLADQRCPNGGWEFGVAESLGVRVPCMTDGGGHVDTTALVLQALLDTDETAADRDGAAEWLAAQQGDNGSFDDNANSTGLAAQALRALGQADAADAAAVFIATLQYGPDTENAGAIRYTADDDGSLQLATTQGILAFGAPAFQLITPPTPVVVDGPTGPCTDTEGVTVVVDLTFFDGEILQGCAAGDPANGLEALTAAGFTTTTNTTDFGTYVCAIEGLPELACDQPFEGQYWAYFAGVADGSWASYQIGADTSDPAPGDVEGWSYDDGSAPGVDAPGATLDRLSSDSRVATAVAVSQAGFEDGTAGAVVLARADEFADALAATPLATAVDGPLLITGSDALDGAVADEVQRVLPAGGTVHALGGTSALSDDVEQALVDLGYDVNRIAGTGRIETAVAVATTVEDLIGTAAKILITTGYEFADALAAGTAAAASGDAVVVLTGDGAPSTVVDTYLADRPEVEVFAVGGPAATAYPDATPIVGATREGTAVAVAEAFFSDPVVAGIARRDGFADALAGGVDAARRGGPLLITPTDGLSADVAAYLCGTDTVETAVVYGGEAAVSAVVVDAVADAIAGDGCA